MELVQSWKKQEGGGSAKVQEAQKCDKMSPSIELSAHICGVWIVVITSWW
jgi:hypothetical protein